MLSSMRTRSGTPNLRVRALALLVALLLAGPPIVLLLLHALSGVLGTLI